MIWLMASTVQEVVSSQYLPGRSKLDNPSRPMLHQRLLDWESSLTPEMRFEAPRGRDAMFLAGMLHMAYKYAIHPFPFLVVIMNDYRLMLLQ